MRGALSARARDLEQGPGVAKGKEIHKYGLRRRGTISDAIKSMCVRSGTVIGV